jgi:hypothetical protein
MPFKDKEKSVKYWKEYHSKFPCVRILSHIRFRCLNKKSDHYKYYGARGIKCLITKSEIKTLWFQDRAYELKNPSIDRKDNDGNYEFSNCRFIELKQNVCLAQDVAILQYDLNQSFLKEWKSISEASRQLKISLTGIHNNLRNLSKSSGGFIWRYKNEVCHGKNRN